MKHEETHMELIATETQSLSAQSVEALLLDGDLAKLTIEDRLAYYRNVCESIGLDWKTQPFNYLRLNGKLQLYPTKRCTDQLRTIRKISIDEVKIIPSNDGIYCISAKASDGDGRTDSDIGAVETTGLKGTMLANAMKKAVTQAKRRVTLSICGLGMLDETEIEQIEGAEVFTPNAVNNAEPQSLPGKSVGQRVLLKDEDMDEGYDYVIGYEPKKSKKDKNYAVVTISQPQHDENGFVKRTQKTGTVWSRTVAMTCKSAFQEYKPVMIDWKQDGEYWNIIEAQTVSLKSPVTPMKTDEIPF
tara:strand:+ start:4063 stop:4965 length:903 start_codon:yes stop_codon:yes gene_type:complete